MKQRKDDYYNLVSDLLTQDEFEDRIVKYDKQFDGLIHADVLAHLVVDELGRNIISFKSISALKPGSKASLFAIVGPQKPKIFYKQKGSPKAAEVFISDSTGSGRLLLWDPKHVELIETLEIDVGTRLKLINAKISKSSFGLDLSLDKYNAILINPEDFPDNEDINHESDITDITSISEDGPVNILGTISGKTQLRAFNRKNKNTGYVLNLDIYDGTGTIRITLWDDHAKTAEEFNIGDQIKVINGYSKMHNSIREIHTNYRTKLNHLTQ